MEATSDDGGTPLMAALYAKKLEIAEFYFKNGANVNVIGRDGETIIHQAIKSGNVNLVKLALERNAPLNHKDPDGKSTLQLAKESENPEIKAMIKEALKEK